MYNPTLIRVCLCTLFVIMAIMKMVHTMHFVPHIFLLELAFCVSCSRRDNKCTVIQFHLQEPMCPLALFLLLR